MNNSNQSARSSSLSSDINESNVNISGSVDSTKHKKNKNKHKTIIALLSIFFIIFIFPAISYIIYDFENLQDEHNPCESEGKMCPSGDVVERLRSNKCEFPKCPETKKDFSRFWTMKNLPDTNRIYENSLYNFSFKQPSDWKFQGRGDSFKLFSPNYDVRDNGFSTTYIGSEVRYRVLDVTTKDISIEEWFNSNEEDTDVAKFRKYDKVSTKIAGIDAIEFSHEFEDSKYKTYLFMHNGAVNSLRFTTHEKNSRKKYQPVLDQIFSSFKFTNTDSLFDPATWKTYINSKWNYSFKYPSTWHNLTNDDYLAKFSSNSEGSNALKNDDIYLEVSLRPRDPILGCGDAKIQYYTKKTINHIGDKKNANIYKFSIDPVKNPDSKFYSTIYRLYQHIGTEDRCYIFNFQTLDSKTSEKYDLLTDLIISSFFTTVSQGAPAVHLNPGDQDLYFLAPQDSFVINKEGGSEISLNGSQFQIFITTEPEKYCMENYTFPPAKENIEIDKRYAYKLNACTNKGYKDLSPQSIQRNIQSGNQIYGIVIIKTYPNEAFSNKENSDLLEIFDNTLEADDEIIAR